ncbi:MAG: CPBP family intramembrane glutamic endopeptidase [Promethearchaeota archaeon]
MEANNPKKKIFKERLNFFIEVVLVFIGIFLLALIPLFVLPLILDSESVYFGSIFFIWRAGMIFIAIPLMIYITDIIFESQSKQIIIEKDISPAMDHLQLYSINKDNYKDQVLLGFLILFIFLIPLDFFTYMLFPEAIPFLSETYIQSSLNYYLLQSYILFLGLAILLHFGVSIYEETLSRGFITMRGGNHMNKMSAVIIASIHFGLLHLTFTSGFSPLIPLIWVSQAFIVGIILSILVLKKGWIFPAILAHALNNIISAHVLWNYLQGNDFSLMFYYMYLPLLCIGVVLLIWKLPLIKKGLNSTIEEIRLYFENDDDIGEANSDKYFRILMDVLFAFLILGISFFLLVG